MWLPQVAYIGILPLSGRDLPYAALDADLNLLALTRGDAAEVLAFCGGQKQAVVAVAAPCAPSLGLLQRPDYRATLPDALRPGRWQQGRVAEYLLRRHNLRMLPTPTEPEKAPSWVRESFRLCRQLEQMGYRPYHLQPEADHQWLETYPHAGFAALLGHLPFSKNSLEGRIQRQLVLREHGLSLPDPLRIFEELTRYRLLQGVLPTENLLSTEELDAIMAALTAYRAARVPDEVTLLGDPEEGQIVLPAAPLKTRYLKTG